ncbi:MAG TPA: PorV/PorQ family protein [bacterium]|nr:PorV/PorQ family protein [bacterium]
MMIIFLILCGFFSGLYAFDDSSSGRFLLLPPNAYALSMGEAMTSLSDSSSEFTNPALMVEQEGNYLELSYMKWFEDISYSNLSFVYPIKGKKRAMGIGANYLGVPNIEAYDENGEPLGMTRVNNWTGGFSVSQRVSNVLSAGVGFRIISLDLAGEKGSGMCFNTGLSLKPSKPLRLAVVFRNLGPDLKIGEILNPLPSVTEYGASYQITDFVMSLDYDSDSKLGLGLDYQISDIFYLRGGYRDLPDLKEGAGISLGLGFREKSKFYLGGLLSYFNYGIAAYGELGFVHSFSLGIAF